MRQETGEALLASSPQLRPGGPTLSSLVVRIVQSRGLAMVEDPLPALWPRAGLPTPALPVAGLVTAPPSGRTVGTATEPFAGLALLGAHGGAGVSCLLRAGLDVIAVDAERRWPLAGAVVLVARTSTSGLEWARDLARQHASGAVGGGVELLGLVLVPDAPGRVPARTAGLRDLVCGAFPRSWQLPWLQEWRLAAATEPLPVHPDVQHLVAELTRTCQLSRTPRMARARGDLL